MLHKLTNKHILAITFFTALLPTDHTFAQTDKNPWLGPAPRFAKEAYFSNLTDGAKIETPYLVKFGLTGIGLAAISGIAPDTGHHHLLVNRELPANFTQPLPFNDQYIHFGKGQMETVLTFKPGTYQLRLVMANQAHIPHFVYSKPISVTVTKQDAAIDPKSLITQGVSILSPAENAVVRAPFRVAFHASGYNVSHAAIVDAGIGHFRLKLQPVNAGETVIEFKNGHTEAWLSPPAGRYTAKLELVSNNKLGSVMATSTPVKFEVQR